MSTRFKPKFNIKKGDTVVVITGDDKDLKKPRKVLEVIVDKGRVVVEGVNISVMVCPTVWTIPFSNI